VTIEKLEQTTIDERDDTLKCFSQLPNVELLHKAIVGSLLINTLSPTHVLCFCDRMDELVDNEVSVQLLNNFRQGLLTNTNI